MARLRGYFRLTNDLFKNGSFKEVLINKNPYVALAFIHLIAHANAAGYPPDGTKLYIPEAAQDLGVGVPKYLRILEEVCSTFDVKLIESQPNFDRTSTELRPNFDRTSAELQPNFSRKSAETRTFVIAKYGESLGSQNTIKEKREKIKDKREKIKEKREKRKDKRETKKETEVSESELLEVYFSYPRKEGKAAGLKKAESQIKTQEQLNDLRQSAKNYRSLCEKEGTAKKYIKHFATFMNCWEDYLDPSTGTCDVAEKIKRNSADDEEDRLMNMMEKIRKGEL